VRVLKRKFHLGFGVLAATSSGARTPALIGCATRPPTTKKRLKEIAKAAPAEDTAQILELNVDTSPSGRRRELRSILPVGSELIVTLAFLGIRQHCIGFIDLFELLLSYSIPGVDVGVIFPSKLAIGLADLVICCVSLYTEYFVIVFEPHRHSSALKAVRGFEIYEEIYDVVSIKYERIIVKFLNAGNQR
jgi:hypothetical protein